jgi:hypothetical protein
MNNADIRQFQLVRFFNENSDDEHVMSKISIVLRRDKIEAPYYMDTQIRISTCMDRPENGLIHAMDMLSHNRRHNLTEEKYSQIKSLILGLPDGTPESYDSKLISEEDRLKIVWVSRNSDEVRSLFYDCGELFDLIDGLAD